jgi:hypothetical protein
MDSLVPLPDQRGENAGRLSPQPAEGRKQLCTHDIRLSGSGTRPWYSKL